MPVEMRTVDPKDLPPAQRVAYEKMRMAAEQAKTPEQRYEAMVGKLPAAARFVAPGTIGEAGFMTGAGAAALAGLALAPETAGISLLGALPLAGSVIGGALEDPKNRLAGAEWEGVKGLGQELGGKLIGKGTELAGRFMDKSGMLARTAERIGGMIPSLFSEYPLGRIPRTAEELQDQIGGGKALNAAGKRLGDFRDALTKRFGPYKAAVPSKLIPASSGVPYHYTPAIPPQGRAFVMPDLDAEGNAVMRRMSVGDAIDHVRELLAGGRTAAGAQKATASGPRVLDTAVKARDMLTAQLNALEPKLGDRYRGLSNDFGVAKQLQKAFAASTRSSAIKGEAKGVIDQPKLLSKADQVAAKLNQIRPGSGTQLRHAVSPTGGAAVMEQGPGIRAHAGESGLRSMFHPPVPYYPETRAVLPAWARTISDPRIRALLGSLGYQVGADALGMKEAGGDNAGGK